MDKRRLLKIGLKYGCFGSFISLFPLLFVKLYEVLDISEEGSGCDLYWFCFHRNEMSTEYA